MKILVFAFTCLTTISSLWADTIAIRADEWCPYNCAAKDANQGFGIEAAKQILEANGHKVDYQTMNWLKAIGETREGIHQAVIGATKEEVPDFIYPDEPIGQSQSVLWAKKGSGFVYTGADSLKGKTIGIIKGYDYGELSDVLKTQKTDIVTGEDSLSVLIKRVEMGRIDFLVEDRFIFLNTIAKLGKSDLFEDVSKDKTTADEIFIAFSPKYAKAKEMATLISDGLKKMKADGSYSKLLEKYGIK